MPKAIFNLKSEPDPRLIILVFRFKKNKFQYSTGEKIAGKFWDKASYRVRATKQFPAYRSVNDLLNTLSHVCEKAHREYLSNCEEQNTVPVWHELKAHLKESLDIATMKKQADENHVRFYDFIDQYIERKKKDRTISAGTTKVLSTWQNLLLEFDKSLSYESINSAFKDKFTHWCYTKKNHSINYVAKGLEVIRQFMAAAKDRGYHSNNYPQTKLFRVKKIPTSTIALSREELEAIHGLDLSGHPDGYGKARDLFLIGAYTGLRHSDYKRIKPDHITENEGEKAIQIMARKTKQQLFIPLHPNLEVILERCGYRSPNLSQQKLNEYIKEVCRMAGITANRAVYSSAGGSVEEQFIPKYKLISSHTARRTFATQARINGWPTTLIRAITGHSTDAQLDNYIDYDMYLSAVQVKEFYKKDRGQSGLKAV